MVKLDSSWYSTLFDVNTPDKLTDDLIIDYCDRIVLLQRLVAIKYIEDTLN